LLVRRATGTVTKAGSAVGEGDLQCLGQEMHAIGRAEPETFDVVAFEDVEHLHDVHARGGRRRRPDDLVATIGTAHRLATGDAVCG